jgi:hypothetical protein
VHGKPRARTIRSPLQNRSERQSSSLTGPPERHPLIAGLHMRRNYWVVVANVVVMAVLAGCSDNIVAPSAAPNAAPASMMFAPADRPSLSLNGNKKHNDATDFTVGPQGGVFYLGNHAVAFSPNAVCDPAVSNYGSAFWDAPCSTLTTPITIHATVKKLAGRSWVDFQPDLRFSPAATVWMFMYTPSAKGAKDLSAFNIFFAESIGGTLVDDAKDDPTLRTYVDPKSGTSFRRIKHFSGYTASGGRDDAIAPPPDEPALPDVPAP